MQKMIKRLLTLSIGAGMLVGALAFSGCKAPKYLEYRSAFGDYSVEVPFGWDVYFDQESKVHTNYTFVGPFDQNFFNGLPSLSIRWYKANHRILMHGLETAYYASGDDYIEQMLRDVYGPQYQFVQKIHRVSVGGWEAKHFIVESLAEVPESYQFGVVIEPDTNRHGIIRKHEYVVLPMDSGFYVLVYPATRAGYDAHSKKFNNLVNTFRVYTDGPSGAKLR